VRLERLHGALHEQLETDADTVSVCESGLPRFDTIAVDIPIADLARRRVKYPKMHVSKALILLLRCVVSYV
jgi:hypothetical protein